MPYDPRFLTLAEQKKNICLQPGLKIPTNEAPVIGTINLALTRLMLLLIGLRPCNIGIILCFLD